MNKLNSKFILGMLIALTLQRPEAALADSWWGAPAETRRMSEQDKAAVDQLLKESAGNDSPRLAMPSAAPVPSSNTVPRLTEAEEKDLRSDESFAEKIRAATKPIYDQEVLNLDPSRKSADGFALPTQSQRPQLKEPIQRSLRQSDSDGLSMDELNGLGNEHFDRPRKKKKRRLRSSRSRRRSSRGRGRTRNRALYQSEFDKMRSERKRRGRKLRVAAREPASSTDASSVETLDPGQAASKPIGLRIAITGGYSSANSTNANVTQSGQVASQSTFAFGVNGDYRSTYFGVELEGYYGLAPEKNQVNGQATFNEFGVLGNVKAHAPLSLGGDARLIPKVGVGFGTIQQKQESITSGGVNVTGSTSLAGAYGVAGLDIELGSKLSVFGDYALSFGGKGSASSTVGGQPGSTNSMEGKFDRIRVGATLKVAEHFRIGGQYINRTLSFGTPSTTTDASEQFMGMLQYEF